MIGQAIRQYVPIVRWLPQYQKRYIAADMLAGLVVAALAIPQSLGYATIAGVPVIVGLYSIPLALIAYAVLGSSPYLMVGPVSTVSVLSGSLVADLAGGDATRAVAFTSALALGAGVGLLAGGLARIGWVAEFLSRPIVTGFVFGLVVLIVLGEIPSLLGLPPVSGDVVDRALSIIGSLGDADLPTVLVSLAALAVLFGGARLAPRIPWGLIVLVVALLASAWLDLSEDGVDIVGTVPRGLPPIGVPGVGLGDLPQIALGGLALAMVGLAEGLSAARIFAARGGQPIDTNQELLAVGAANLAAGFCGGMSVAGSLSKTASAHRSGGRTQLTGLSAAVLVLATVALLVELLAPLPRAVLSAIVVQAVWGLMDGRALLRYREVRRNDFVAAIAAMLGVLALGPLYGLLVAVGISVLGLVYRSSQASMEVMGKVPDEKAAWGSVLRHPERETIDGILVLRLDSPLFWANAAEIGDQVLSAVAASGSVKAVLVDLEATSQLDITSIDMLEELLQRLRGEGVDVYLVRVFHQARQVLERAGFTQRLGRDHMWHSISAGVRAARRDHDLDGKRRGAGIELPSELADIDDRDTDDASSERITPREQLE